MERHSCFDDYAGDDELMQRYHDEEWGKPCRDEQKLIEMLILETFQAGLSWKTVLHKREAFRNAFDDFNIERIAAYPPEKIEELMTAPGIIHNRRKIEGMVSNARCIKDIQREFGSFSNYLWHFTKNHTIIEAITVTTDDLSDDVSRDMKKRGMKFVGSITIFSYLQSVGIIYSHPEDCFRYAEDHAENFIGNAYENGKFIRKSELSRRES